MGSDETALHHTSCKRNLRCFDTVYEQDEIVRLERINTTPLKNRVHKYMSDFFLILLSSKTDRLYLLLYM